MINVEITGWQRGFLTISFMKLLREGSQSGRSLAEAKALVDGLLAGHTFSLDFESEDEARKFVTTAGSLGAVASARAGT